MHPLAPERVLEGHKLLFLNDWKLQYNTFKMSVSTQCVQVTVQTISSSVMTAAVLTSLTPVTGSNTAQTALMKTSAPTVRSHCFPQSLLVSVNRIWEWTKNICKTLTNVSGLICDFFSWQQQEVSGPPRWTVKPSCCPDRGDWRWLQQDHRKTSGQEHVHSWAKFQSTGDSSQSRSGCVYSLSVTWRGQRNPNLLLCCVVIENTKGSS